MTSAARTRSRLSRTTASAVRPAQRWAVHFQGALQHEPVGLPSQQARGSKRCSPPCEICIRVPLRIAAKKYPVSPRLRGQLGFEFFEARFQAESFAWGAFQNRGLHVKILSSYKVQFPPIAPVARLEIPLQIRPKARRDSGTESARRFARSSKPLEFIKLISDLQPT